MWHKVTWYSKLLAIVVFVGILPAIAFYIGMQYELAINGKPTTSAITVSVSGQKNNIVVSTTPPSTQSVFQLQNPVGGETFKAGQHVTIKWNDNPAAKPNPSATLSTVNIQIVSDRLDTCSTYTGNTSAITCKVYGVYSGPNNGSFDWVVPSEYSGKYMVRIWPDIGMETAHQIFDKGFSADTYSGLFTIAQ